MVDFVRDEERTLAETQDEYQARKRRESGERNETKELMEKHLERDHISAGI